jgi:predicted NUDIX family phosphoesterase
MRDYGGEQILVVPRALFEEIGAFNGIRTDVSEAIGTLLDPENHFFMDRAAAEEDPGHKQIILYCVFRHDGRFLRYTRGKSGGESRLHSLGSIGIGGHVNPIDASEGRFGTEAYHAAVRREIDEELVIAGGWTERIVALLNDDSNAVGQVHLGVVHLVDLESGDVRAHEDALADLALHTLEELRGPLYEGLETWSKFCVDALAAGNIR